MRIVFLEQPLLLLMEELKVLHSVAEEHIFRVKNDEETRCFRLYSCIDMELPALLVRILDGQVSYVWVFDSNLEFLGHELLAEGYHYVDVFGGHSNLVYVLFFSLVEIKQLTLIITLHFETSARDQLRRVPLLLCLGR